QAHKDRVVVRPCTQTHPLMTQSEQRAGSVVRVWYTARQRGPRPAAGVGSGVGMPVREPLPEQPIPHLDPLGCLLQFLERLQWFQWVETGQLIRRRQRVN